MKINGISYQTKVTCIDVDTGEQITQDWAHKHYSIIKTKKEMQYVGKYKTTRIIHITKLYRNNKQLQLAFPRDREIR